MKDSQWCELVRVEMVGGGVERSCSGGGLAKMRES